MRFNASLLDLHIKLQLCGIVNIVLYPEKKHSLHLKSTIIPFSIIYKLLLYVFPSTILSPSQMSYILFLFPLAIFHFKLYEKLILGLLIIMEWNVSLCELCSVNGKCSMFSVFNFLYL